MVSNAGMYIILCVPVFSGSLLKCVDGYPCLLLTISLFHFDNRLHGI